MNTELARMDIQNEFISQLIESKQLASVYLMSGLHLKGILKALTDDYVILDNRGNMQQILKHSIATITTSASRQETQ